MEQTKCLIIGSGPAGYTAAIYAGRANLSPIEYCGMQPGGQLMQTTEVENYPGYPQGVDANQMMMEFREQAERFGADIRDGVIVKVDFSKAPYVCTADDGKEIAADTVIIATGSSAKYQCQPVPPATDSSIVRRRWLWLAVVIRPVRMHSIFLVWPRRCI